MYTRLFNEFITTSETLQIYRDGRRLFSSKKDRLLPLLDYLEETKGTYRQIAVLDRVTGNAAALLSILAGATEIYSRMGSRIAVKTLGNYSVKCYFDEVVPYIQRKDGNGMCPMEELSLGKKPGEFYQALLDKINREA
jgi:hypothetical protein